jgi:hypothetical protein
MLGAVAATGCLPVSFGETSTLRLSEVWPSHGAHVDAALIEVRVDGRLMFRRFAPLTEKRAYSADDTGHYTISAGVYRCSGACQPGKDPRPGDRRIARCSLRADFEGSRGATYLLVVRTGRPSCRLRRGATSRT